MDYHYEREIRLNDESEHLGSNEWALEEFDSEGNQVEASQIPWKWSFTFSASEFRLNRGLGFGELSFFDEDDEPGQEPQKLEQSEIIRATLHPGYCDDGKWLEDDTRFSMFGTDREITEFSLLIRKVQEQESEHCSVWGMVGYTSEIDFRDETSPDSIQFELALSAEKFDNVAQAISNKEIDFARLRVNKVSGFYSEWSPSITTNRVKVLTKGSNQEIITSNDCDIVPPKLGEIGKLDLNLVTRCHVNPKQDLTALNISKLFEEETFSQDEVEVPEDITRSLLIRIAENQAEIMKLKNPLWIAVFLLGLLVLGTWI